MKIGFRRLGEKDHPLLHEWLQRDHVRRWWDNVAGVDLFLANADQTGRGLGSRVLDAFANDVVFARPTVRACIANPAVGNAASIRAFEKAGFTRVRELRDPTDEHPLHMPMRRDR